MPMYRHDKPGNVKMGKLALLRAETPAGGRQTQRLPVRQRCLGWWGTYSSTRLKRLSNDLGHGMVYLRANWQEASNGDA